jgi:SHS2 domain-containing protein
MKQLFNSMAIKTNSGRIEHLARLVYISKIRYSSVMKKYKLLDHTADIRLLVCGKTRKELFANAVTAMYDVMLDVSDHDEFRPLEEKTVEINGNDLEDTLINFIRETLYLFNGQGWLVVGCTPLALTSKSIVARLKCEPYNRHKATVKTEIKAVTYHGLKVSKTSKSWQARLVFDV